MRQDEATGHVSLTLRESEVRAGEKGFLTWESDNLKKGLKVKGKVTSVKNFGVFIQVEGSMVSMLKLSYCYPSVLQFCREVVVERGFACVLLKLCSGGSEGSDTRVLVVLYKNRFWQYVHEHTLRNLVCFVMTSSCYYDGVFVCVVKWLT